LVAGNEHASQPILQHGIRRLEDALTIRSAGFDLKLARSPFHFEFLSPIQPKKLAVLDIALRSRLAQIDVAVERFGRGGRESSEGTERPSRP